MSTLKTFSKAAAAKLDYSISWADWLPAGDTIDTAVWTADEGVTLSDDSVTGSVATVWIEGGTAGSGYLVTCTVTTDDGRIDERSIALTVK